MPLPVDLAFVDVETTGMSPQRDRVIEVAVVRLRMPRDGWGPPAVERFCSLVDPQRAIDPGIRFLTGITQERLQGAPRFEAVAARLSETLEGALFVAHHARFDHGFLKAEFGRCEQRFETEPLCTVRLSRALEPGRSQHGLDALIARHRLGPVERHTALGDAEVLWRLWQKLLADHGQAAMTAQIKRLLGKPSLPAHLGVASIEALPARPGVYAFEGLNGQPLYIGKSLNLRERVPAHFSADHRSERGLRLASETRGLRWQVCAGEFGALLGEALAITRLLPAQNRASRRVSKPHVLVADPDGLRARPRPWHELPADQDWAGPFTSRQSARAWLAGQARARRMCLATLGLERVVPGQACFAYQLGRCPGTCLGRHPPMAHADELRTLLATGRPPTWPTGHAVLLHEHDPRDRRNAWHLSADWRWLGSAHDEPGLARLLRALASPTAPPSPVATHIEHGEISDLVAERPADANPDLRVHRLLVQWLAPVVGLLASAQAPPIRQAADLAPIGRPSSSDDPGWVSLRARARRDVTVYRASILRFERVGSADGGSRSTTAEPLRG
ncbi:MAG: exonuclease domain-containing protein [Burkholderiaceae bacterium]